MKLLMSICSKILGVSPGSLNYSEDSESSRESFRGMDNKHASHDTETPKNAKREQEEEENLCPMDWED